MTSLNLIFVDRCVKHIVNFDRGFLQAGGKDLPVDVINACYPNYVFSSALLSSASCEDFT